MAGRLDSISGGGLWIAHATDDSEERTVSIMPIRDRDFIDRGFNHGDQRVASFGPKYLPSLIYMLLMTSVESRYWLV